MTRSDTGAAALAADDLRFVLAALVAAIIGALFYNVLPLYLGTAADTKSLSSAQIGFLGAAFFMGFNIAGASAFAWVRIWAWRTVAAAAIPLAVVALLASAAATSYAVLLLTTIVSGGALGAMFSIAGVALGDTSKPTRWYGVKTAVESLFGAVLMIVLTSSLSPSVGFGETIGGMIVLIALLAPALAFLPSRPAAPPVGETQRGDATVAAGHPRSVFCALGVVLVFFAGNSGIWAFSERLGAVSGFDAGAVGVLLSFTLVCGVGGSLAIAAWGARFNPVVVIGGACAAVVVALLALGMHFGFGGYAFGLCLYMVGWSAGVPLSFAEVARFDPDGRYTALATPALGLGSMAGPAIVGLLYGEAHDTGAVIAFGVVCMALTFGLAVAANAQNPGAFMRRIVSPAP